MKYCTDVNVHDRHILLFYEKCHFQELLPFVRVQQFSVSQKWFMTDLLYTVFSIDENQTHKKNGTAD